MKDVFARIEKKYRLSAVQHRYMLEVLAAHVSPDAYGKSRLESLYFDTPNRDLIARSIEKPLYKEKLRVRRYVPLAGPETGAGAGDAFVEIKKKFKGVVYKRRVVMSWDGALAYLEGMPLEEAKRRYPRAAVLAGKAPEHASSAYEDEQIHREIDSLLARYEDLRPSMLIACDRQAFFGTPESALADTTTRELRVTFDGKLTYTDCFADGRPTDILADGEVIMEIKCAGTYPLWLARALSAKCIYPQSFSKYGAAYQAVMSGTRRPSAPRTRSVEDIYAAAPTTSYPIDFDFEPVIAFAPGRIYERKLQYA